MKKYFLSFVIILTLLTPVFVFAQDQDIFATAQAGVELCMNVKGVANLLCKLHGILNSIIPLLVSIGVVYFVWGVVRYMIADGEEAKQKGKDTVIYGIIGLAVIVSLWGIVNLVTETFNLDSAAPQLGNLDIKVSGGEEQCTINKNSSLKGVLCYFTQLINDSVIPFMFAVATVFFIWGAIKFFILEADEEAKRDQGKQFMIWGVVALAVMLSVWGLVALITSTFGVDGRVLPQVNPNTSTSP